MISGRISLPILEKEFLYPLKNYKSLIRGRKGIWDKAENLSAPSIEVATKNGILNRWNPPEKRYLYLVDATNISLEIAEQTCFEEMRITNAETKVTIGNFQVIPKEKNNKILNLDYERTTLKDIFQRLEVAKKKETDLIICDLKRDNIRNKEKIKSYVRAHRAETEIVVQIFAADFLLKQISSTIFGTTRQ